MDEKISLSRALSYVLLAVVFIVGISCAFVILVAFAPIWATCVLLYLVFAFIDSNTELFMNSSPNQELMTAVYLSSGIFCVTLSVLLTGKYWYPIIESVLRAIGL